MKGNADLPWPLVDVDVAEVVTVVAEVEVVAAEVAFALQSLGQFCASSPGWQMPSSLHMTTGAPPLPIPGPPPVEELLLDEAEEDAVDDVVVMVVVVVVVEPLINSARTAKLTVRFEDGLDLGEEVAVVVVVVVLVVVVVVVVVVAWCVTCTVTTMPIPELKS